MIDYSPFWHTLKESKENWYTLTKKHHISDSTLHRLKHNRDISMKTINDLCRILKGPSGNRAFQTGAGMTHTSYACP